MVVIIARNIPHVARVFPRLYRVLDASFATSDRRLTNRRPIRPAARRMQQPRRVMPHSWKTNVRRAYGDFRSQRTYDGSTRAVGGVQETGGRVHPDHEGEGHTHGAL